MKLKQARRFIKSAMKSKGDKHPSIGLGTNVKFELRSVSGAALIEGDRLLHLSAFKKQKGETSPKVGYRRYSQRRTLR